MSLSVSSLNRRTVGTPFKAGSSVLLGVLVLPTQKPISKGVHQACLKTDQFCVNKQR